MDALYYIENLHMLSHPEGGYFAENCLSGFAFEDLGAHVEGCGEPRRLFSSIYFLLSSGEVSHFHRLKSDEMWYYHAGDPLTVYTIAPDGTLTARRLGLAAEKGESPQLLVEAGMIFGSAMEADGFSLVGCMCAPCFRYEEFELFTRSELLKLFPQHEEIITRLTREE